MTTSDYTKTQTDLLIMLKDLRRLRLEEFAARARGAVYYGEPVRDHEGWPVVSDPERMAEIADAAIEFRDRALMKPAGQAGQAKACPTKAVA